MKWIVATALAVVLGASTFAADADGVRIDGEPQVIGTAPRSLYSPHLDDRRVTQETWDYVFWFPSGHRLLAQFQVTDSGPGSRMGLVAALIVFPDKTTRLIKNSRPRGEWQQQVSGADVRLTLVRHVFEFNAARHRIHIEGDSQPAAFDVDAEAISPAVSLGTVRYPGGRDWYEMAILAPRVRATATLRLDGRPPVTLGGGGGIVLHSTATLADYNQALSVFRLHTFDKPVETSLISFLAPDGRNGTPVGWLLLMRDGQPPEIRRAADRQYSEFVKEREDPGYTSPRRVQIRGTGVDTTVGLSLFARLDIVGWINSALGRFVARRFFHPVQYLFDGRYELRVGSDAPVAGTGFGLLWILNQPKTPSWP